MFNHFKFSETFRGRRSVLPLFFLCFTLILPTHALAQAIEGKVLDAATQQPLEGATVLETGTTNGTATDSEGNFRLTLTSDTAELTVSFVGFQTRQVAIAETAEFLVIRLEEQVILSGEIFVRALRVDDSTPIAYSNMNREEIESRIMGQDIPYLIRNTPSVVFTSDAGAGIGYTGFRVRGVDPGRINVTINGIPLNDSESHGVFWVNMPDLASSTQNIQIQRGVGTSTQGAGAFGATMNLQTAIMNPDPYAEINSGVGAYGTRTANIQLGSGLMNNGWQFEGRVSRIDSEGYIDRATSDLRSFYLSGSRHGERSLLKMDLISGEEVTYQAWNGVPEPILNNNSGQLEQYIDNLFLDSDDASHWRSNIGNRRFNEFTYENQVDNYKQDHVQLHYSYKIKDHWIANTSLHYTYGRGYFEQFRRGDRLSSYNIDPVVIGNQTVSRSDLVRRRWLENHFYGVVFSSQIDHPEEWSFTLGGGYNEYDGDHFGEVIWARFAGDSNLGDRYYDNNGFKTDFNLYGKLNYYLNPSLNLFADLQYRTVLYRFLGLRADGVSGEVSDVSQNDRIHFFNPKTGVVLRFADTHRAFASFSVGGKEPTRRDYVESTVESRPDPERLYDFELGYSGIFGKLSTNLNLYYMLYRDQLINTGEINDVGNIVRENVPDSYRAGVELELGARLLPELHWNGNITLSRNLIREYIRFVDDFDAGGQRSETYTDVEIAFSPSVTGSSMLSYYTGSFRADWMMSFVSSQYLDNTANPDRALDGYWVNDLKLDYTTGRSSVLKNVTISLQINNVLDHKYVSNGYTFGWIAGGREQFFNYYYPQAGRHLMMNLKVQF